jgi:hypothetical protein
LKVWQDQAASQLSTLPTLQQGTMSSAPAALRIHYELNFVGKMIKQAKR